MIRYKDILAQFPDAYAAPNANIKVPGSTQRPPFISAPGTYPYAHNIYFETPSTAVAKLNFLKNVGAQGVIIWELSNDIWQEGKSIIKELYRNSGNPSGDTRKVIQPLGAQIITLGPGVLGYRGIPNVPITGTWTATDTDHTREPDDPNPANGDEMAPQGWEGAYAAQSADEAAGYAGPRSGNGPGSLWQVQVPNDRNIQVFRVYGGQPNENGQVEVQRQEVVGLIRRLFHLPSPAPGEDNQRIDNLGIIDWLGQHGFAYMGPGAPGRQEIAFSDEFRQSHNIQTRAIAETTYRGTVQRTPWVDAGGQQIGEGDQLNQRFPEANWPAPPPPPSPPPPVSEPGPGQPHPIPEPDTFHIEPWQQPDWPQDKPHP